MNYQVIPVLSVPVSLLDRVFLWPLECGLILAHYCYFAEKLNGFCRDSVRFLNTLLPQFCIIKMLIILFPAFACTH